MSTFEQEFNAMPLVAIIRGAQPDEMEELGKALLFAGIKIVEVPLNSPDPLNSIKRLVDLFDGQLIIGAGTVLTTEEVESVHSVGATFCVSPNTNQSVIKKSINLNMLPIPGYQTPTEAFKAVDAGAKYLKCFPISSVGFTGINSHKAILPDVKIIGVGGISLENAHDYLNVGCHGFGLASSLYKPGDCAIKVKEYATLMVNKLRVWRKE